MTGCEVEETRCGNPVTRSGRCSTCWNLSDYCSCPIFGPPAPLRCGQCGERSFEVRKFKGLGFFCSDDCCNFYWDNIDDDSS